MPHEKYDVIIVGAGPGGYTAAIRARQLGLKTALVEKRHLGGICLNWGCIPTKALLRSAEIYHMLRTASAYGISAKEVRFDLEAIVKRSRAVSAKLNAGIDYLMKKNGVDILWGEAQLTENGTLEVSAAEHPPKGAQSGGVYKADHIILATGARPRAVPGIEPDGSLIWTYFEAMVPPKMPKSLLVIGSGAIGVEFASFYRSFDVEVHLVEIADRILTAEDPEISALARKRFEALGMSIATTTRVKMIAKNKEKAHVTLVDEEGKETTCVVDRVILAAGVVGNIENLGLEALGVTCARGCICTDAFCRTNVSGVYAIGDVAGPPMLAHKAEHEAIVCVEAIAGQNPEPLNRNLVPGCTYSYPQIASVGLTELQAREQEYEIKVGRFPFQANGKAIAMGEDEGLVKTIFDARTGQLLGAHMIGAEVTELIQGFVIAMTLETTEAELMHTIFPHPTLSEMMKESVLEAYGRALNM